MKKYYKLLLIIAIILSTSTLFAQYKNTSSNKSGSNKQMQTKKTASPLSKIYVGGNIGGGWSSNSAFFELSPIVGYRITPLFDMGTRLTYIYNKFTDYYGFKKVYNDIGASVFTRYHLFNFLFVQAEFEELSAQYYLTDGKKSRRWVPGLFVGGGVYQHMGPTFLHMAILYNLLDSEYSPYSNPVIRIGFGVGL